MELFEEVEKHHETSLFSQQANEEGEEEDDDSIFIFSCAIRFLSDVFFFIFLTTIS